MSLIQVKNIHKSYENLQVLKGVTTSIKAKEIVSIVGASGAGKSTLLHLMGALDNADKGEIIFDGANISKYSEKELAAFRNEKIGFVFQFHHLLPEFSAIENVCIPAYLGNKNEQEAKERAAYLLEILGLKDRIEHRPNQMSGGEQQRVSVARALMNNPKVILADEPSGNLDTKTSNDLHELFLKLRDDFNQTFVIVTHNEALAEISDRKLVMKDGLLVG